MASSKITKYTPGFNIHDVQKKYNVKNVIKLASNENPYVSEKVKQYIVKKDHDLNFYPDSNPEKLLSLISDIVGHGMKSKNIILGNGSNEILEFIARASLQKSSEVIIPKHSFLVYEIICKLLNAKIVVSNPVRDKNHPNYLGINLSDVMKKITKKTKLIFLANPCNPVGTYLSCTEIKKFLNSISNKINVVLDEAYYEYLDSKTHKSAASLVAQYNNLYVTRSFSKIYGLASLRVGYGISNRENIDKIKLYKQPFNTNSFAQKVTSLALNDKNFIKKSKNNNDISMKELLQTLDSLSISYLGTRCNFLTFKVGKKANDLFLYLLKHGIIVRPLNNYKLNDYLRVSIGKPNDNKKFIKYLKLFYSEEI